MKLIQKIHNHKPSKTELGLTLVELIVAVSIAMVISFTFVAAMITWTEQYAIGSVRNTLTTNAQTALDKISNDIRRSAGVMPNNFTEDPNAPTDTGIWESNESQVVISQIPVDDSGDSLHTIPGDPSNLYDSIVYYLHDETLYKRVIAASYTENRAETAICSQVPAGGCYDSDIKITSGVKDIAFTYQDSEGNNTTPGSAKIVLVDLTLEKQQSNQTITITEHLATALRKGVSEWSTTAETDADLALGPAGISLVNNSTINGTAATDIYLVGGVESMSSSNRIGSASQRLGTIYAANLSCGSGSSYMQSCSPSEPLNFGWGSIYANEVCATDQVTTSTTFGTLQTLNPGCDAPQLSLPSFNKGAHTASMTSTATQPSCAFGCTTTLNANTKYIGNFGSSGGTYTIAGNLYITGNFGNVASGGGSATVFKAADGLTERPIVVVNGIISTVFTTVIPNNNGVTPIFISFYSADTACSQSDTCNERTPSNIYNTGNAITLDASYNTLAGANSFNASVYAYYGKVSLSQTTFNGSIAGQGIYAAASTLNLQDLPWPN